MARLPTPGRRRQRRIKTDLGRSSGSPVTSRSQWTKWALTGSSQSGAPHDGSVRDFHPGISEQNRGLGPQGTPAGSRAPPSPAVRTRTLHGPVAGRLALSWDGPLRWRPARPGMGGGLCVDHDLFWIRKNPNQTKSARSLGSRARTVGNRRRAVRRVVAELAPCGACHQTFRLSTGTRMLCGGPSSEEARWWQSRALARGPTRTVVDRISLSRYACDCMNLDR